MSTDLPFLGGCMGYSSDAIRSYRHAAHVSPAQTFNHRMSTIQKSIGLNLTAPQHTTSTHSMHAATNSPTRHTCTAPLTINLQPYQGHTSSPAASSSIPSPTKISSSQALDSSSKLATPSSFLLKTVNFEIISDSSVGGMGLPRPYGRFIANRGGDGHAVFERLPPPQKHATPSRPENPPIPPIPYDEVKGQDQLEGPPGAETSGARGGLQSIEVPAFKSKSGLQLPMASRLKTSGTDRPENIRMDCGYGLAKSFMVPSPTLPLSPVQKPSNEKPSKEAGSHTWAMTSISQEEDGLMEETLGMLNALSGLGVGSKEGVADAQLSPRLRRAILQLPPEHTLPRRNTRVGK